MTSAIVPLVSFRNRLRQALSCCSGFFHSIFSMTSGIQTVKCFYVINHNINILKDNIYMLLYILYTIYLLYILGNNMFNEIENNILVPISYHMISNLSDFKMLFS